MIAGLVEAQAWTLGSTKKPSVCSKWMRWRALLEGDRGALRVVDPPAHEAVRVVRGSEEQHLTHHVEQTVGQEPRLEERARAKSIGTRM